MEEKKEVAQRATKEKKERLFLRLSETEKKSLQRKAETAGLPLSEFCRRALQNSEVRILSRDEIRNINGLSNNLNQLIRLWNTFGGNPPEMVDTLSKLIEEVKRLYKD